MSYKLVDENSIISIADAIRLKGGTSASLVFPSGFVSAIGDISGGGGSNLEDGIIQRTISGTYENSRVTQIGSYAFYSCRSLTTASFPNVTIISNHAFAYCSGLTAVSFPNVISIGSNAFYSCYSLTTVSFSNVTSIVSNVFAYCSGLTAVSFPNVTTISNNAFYYCSGLTTVSFPNVTSIGSNAFRNCYNLVSAIFLASSVISLSTSAFYSTPIGGYTASTGGVYGSIFVPASLYNSYITATNWSTYSARIVSFTN